MIKLQWCLTRKWLLTPGTVNGKGVTYAAETELRDTHAKMMTVTAAYLNKCHKPEEAKANLNRNGEQTIFLVTFLKALLSLLRKEYRWKDNKTNKTQGSIMGGNGECDTGGGWWWWWWQWDERSGSVVALLPTYGTNVCLHHTPQSSSTRELFTLILLFCSMSISMIMWQRITYQ